MRIGIDCRGLKKNFMSGADRYLANFLEVAIKERPQHDFFLYGNKESHINFSGTNVIVRRMHEWNTQWYDQVTLGRQTKRDNLDVFFSPFDKAPILSACPVVITIHDMHFFLLHSEESRPFRFFYNSLYLLFKSKPMARKARLIISVSSYTKREVVRLLNIRESKIAVISNGVSKCFKPIKDKEKIEEFKKEYHIGKRYLLYVGNFMPHKNVLSLVASYHLLREELKDNYQLVLCGKKDKYYPRIRDKIKELRLEENTVFIDFVSDNDLPVLYSAAEVFIYPSLYEGFGLPPLEAMACGTPVVSSNAASLPEVIGDSGILVDASNPSEIKGAVEKFLDTPALLNDYKKKGIDRAREFCSDRTVRRLWEAVESCCLNGNIRQDEMV